MAISPICTRGVKALVLELQQRNSALEQQKEAELAQQKALVLELQQRNSALEQQNSLLRSTLRKEKELTAGEKLENELLHDELKQMAKKQKQAASILQRLQRSLRAERADKEQLQRQLQQQKEQQRTEKEQLQRQLQQQAEQLQAALAAAGQRPSMQDASTQAAPDGSSILGSLKAQVAATTHRVTQATQAEEFQQRKRTITEEDRIRIRKEKGAPTSRRHSAFMDHVRSRTQAEADFSAAAAATRWKRKGKKKAGSKAKQAEAATTT